MKMVILKRNNMEYTSNCLLQEAQIELLKNKIQELQDENAALMKQLHPSGTEEYITTVTKPYKIIKDDNKE
jgi:hypothetical protein